MNLLDLMNEINEKHSEFERLYPHFIEAKILYENLLESKKFILASNTKIEGPEWKAKAEAETSEEYETLMAGIQDARKRFLKGQAAIDPIKMRIESLRTLISALKQEVRQFGG